MTNKPNFGHAAYKKTSVDEISTSQLLKKMGRKAVEETFFHLPMKNVVVNGFDLHPQFLLQALYVEEVLCENRRRRSRGENIFNLKPFTRRSETIAIEADRSKRNETKRNGAKLYALLFVPHREMDIV